MRWSPAGVWSFFQTDNRALQYAGILDQDDGGQLPVACKEALDVLLGVILVYTFYFQLYFIFSVKLAITWRCGPEAESSTVISPDFWPCVRAVVSAGSFEKIEDVELTLGSNCQKKFVNLIFVNHSKKKKKKEKGPRCFTVWHSQGDAVLTHMSHSFFCCHFLKFLLFCFF